MNQHRRGFFRWFALGVTCLGAGGFSVGTAAQPQIQQTIEIREVPADVDSTEDESLVDPLTAAPGFRLPMANEDFRKQIIELNGFLDAGDWGNAFKLLSQLGDDQLDNMVPVDAQGLHRAVRVQLQNRLLAMPLDGRRGFRLYFDGQAREELNAIRGHRLPGSDEQLALAQRMVDRLLASSVGGEAADLLGDLYFERGGFARAHRCWKLALDHGSVTGKDALTLQVKRAIAMRRAGDLARAATLYQQLKARYTDATITVGGQAVDAIALLGESLEQIDLDAILAAQQTPARPITLPKDESLPTWYFEFIDASTLIEMSSITGRNNYYRGPQDLKEYVPSVVADDQRVYFHWLGAVFALDRASGKIVWKQGSIQQAAQSMTQRMQTNAGDPRNYNIALADEVLLVSSTPNNTSQNPVFSITAYSTLTGQTLWQSRNTQSWAINDGREARPVSVLGEVLVADNWGYAIVHRQGESDCFLHRFDPATGEVASTLRLGEADAVNFGQYVNLRRMPQPKMVMGESMLYVLMNNGGLVAVDMTAGEIAWALRMPPPYGVGVTGSRGQAQQLGPQIDAFNNPNGSGQVILRDGIVYAKEHNGKALFAADAITGEVQWSADKLAADARLIGVDDDMFYLMNQSLYGYWIKGDQDLRWSNSNDTGKTRNAAALIDGEQVLLLTPSRLRLFETEHGDMVKQYEQSEQNDYLGSNGGRLYRFDNLLICIDKTQITAFELEQTNPE